MVGLAYESTISLHGELIAGWVECDLTAKNTTIASESLSGEITGKTYEAKKIHP